MPTTSISLSYQEATNVMATKEIATLQGIEYLVDPAGKRTAVVIDLERWGELWKDFCATITVNQDHPRPNGDRDDEQQTFTLEAERERELTKLQAIAPVGIVFPTKPLKKAVMPTIRVTGKPLSQMIIEDRR